MIEMERLDKSFVEVSPESHFPIQNLPYGVCRRPGEEAPRICVAIGELVLDLNELEVAGLFAKCEAVPAGTLSSSTLNPFMALGKKAWTQVRETLKRLLDVDERHHSGRHGAPYTADRPGPAVRPRRTDRCPRAPRSFAQVREHITIK